MPHSHRRGGARRAVFLDRDGTLIRVVLNQNGEEDSASRAEDVSLIQGAGEFTRRIRERGYLAVLATNQPGIAKGSITSAELQRIHQQLLFLLAKEGGGLDHIYYCPHHPTGRSGHASPFVQVCQCRKPAPGLLLQAASDLDIDLSKSWMIGDRLSDVEAGRRAGCESILLQTQGSAKTSEFNSRDPDHFACTLFCASMIVLSVKRRNVLSEKKVL